MAEDIERDGCVQSPASFSSLSDHDQYRHDRWAHLWQYEAPRRALQVTNPSIRIENETQLPDVCRNTTLTRFGRSLIDRMDIARRKHRDLYTDPAAFYKTFCTLMQQLAPSTTLPRSDATAGATGFIIYLYHTSAAQDPWQHHISELPVASLLHDPNCLREDFSTFLQVTGQQRYSMRWIHLPCNNMEWVEQIMGCIVADLLRNTKNQNATIHSEATNCVVQHVLHPKRWTARQNDRSPDMVHGRSMESQSQQFTVATTRPGGEAFAALSKRSFVFFMPYLSWERSTVVGYCNSVYRNVRKQAEALSIDGGHDIRVDSTKATAMAADIPCCEREALLRNYLFTRHPMHLRRTLDQSYYTNMSDTDDRDQDQVVERYAKGQRHWNLRDRMDPCILMVDQLWLWVLNKGMRTTIPNSLKETNLR